jgi:hypothetical protein
MNESRNHTR